MKEIPVKKGEVEIAISSILEQIDCDSIKMIKCFCNALSFFSEFSGIKNEDELKNAISSSKRPKALFESIKISLTLIEAVKNKLERNHCNKV